MEKQKTIEELVSEQLVASREEIIKNGIDGVKESIKNEISWKIGNVISKEVEKMFEEEVVKNKLAEEVGKVKILFVESFSNELLKVMPSISSEMAKSIQKRAIKNLTEDSYSMREVYKKIFD